MTVANKNWLLQPKKEKIRDGISLRLKQETSSMFEFNSMMIWNIQATLIDIAIVFLLFVSLRVVKGMISNVHATDEIASRDNIAFGISFAGALLALGIMLTGVSKGAFGYSLLNEALTMAAYGVAGLFLIMVGRFFQDKFVLPSIDLHQQIKQGNVTAAIVDVGHVSSVGIIVHGVMLWVNTQGWQALPVILAAFAISQLLLALVSKYRVHLFKAASGDSECIQKAMEEGNIAIGVRYAGFLVGASLAISASSGFIRYEPDHAFLAAIFWGIAALVMLVVFFAIQFLAMKVLLWKVNISDEVDRQKNTGVAAIEAALSCSLGMILVSLLV